MYVLIILLQITSPRFPVVVKMGHAHSGMGKVVPECSSVCSVQCEHNISWTKICLFIFIFATTGKSG